MTASECIRFLRDNPRMSVKHAAQLTGCSKEDVRRYAKYAGIELVSLKKKYDICAGKPKSCENCPFDDCIDNSPATAEETRYVNEAFGVMRNDGRRS